MEYTPDKDFSDFEDGDQSAVVFGYIFQVEAPKTVGKKFKYRLLKFVLTNGSKKISCLIWGDELIKKYQKDIIINQKVLIDGARLKESKTYVKDDSFVDLEVNIQTHTELSFHGTHSEIPAVNQEIRDVELSEIANNEGVIIRTSGYVRTRFVQAFLHNNTSTYASGAITDGRYKITVHITQYEENFINKGTKVRIVGKVSLSTSGCILLQVEDFSNVDIMEEEEHMSTAELIRGCKTPRRSIQPSERSNDNGEDPII